jgi:hypothetical protein
MFLGIKALAYIVYSYKKSNEQGPTIMTEKTVSKYLLNLEKYFANDNPILLQAAKIFHELDQVEYDLGLIDMDETTASKKSWWPIVSLIGGNSTAKSRFINSYFGSELLFSGIQASHHKFTALLYSTQPASTILPGTALDVDHRYPFYQISHKIEQRQAGEGERINAYLELRTLNSDRLKNRLFIDAPNMSAAPNNPVISLLTQHVVENSDLVFVFTDVFDSSTPLIDELIAHIIRQQDLNKFVYLIDGPAPTFYPTRHDDLIASCQRKLAEFGLDTGQFIVVPHQQGIGSPTNRMDFAEIDQRMANADHNRSYRILHALDLNIHELDSVLISEVKQNITIWKDRSNMSSLVVLGFIASLLVLAEVQIGILDLLIDPIIGPIILAVLVAVMIPLHLMFNRIYAKFTIERLNVRQKELQLMENLSGLFEKNLTFSRIMLSLSEPVGWNKKTKARLAQLSNKTKELVQSLNDSFSAYRDQVQS